jgi:hypothetical protein
VLPDHRQLVLFPPRAARWLRLTLSSAHGWTVSELHVFGIGEDSRPGLVLPNERERPPRRHFALRIDRWLQSLRPSKATQRAADAHRG